MSTTTCPAATIARMAALEMMAWVPGRDETEGPKQRERQSERQQKPRRR